MGIGEVLKEGNAVMNCGKKEIADRHLYAGGDVSRWLGVAYHDTSRRVTVFYPIPLNWLIGWGRRAYYFLVHGPRDRVAELLGVAASRGFTDGYRDGHRDGCKDGIAEEKRRVAGIFDAFEAERKAGRESRVA